MSNLVPCFLPRVAARSAPEDSLTEAVAHLLEFADGLRKRFQAYLWPGSDDSVESELRTQRGGEAGGRVDMRWILDRRIPNGRRAILECKLNALFTYNQPTVYLAELSKRAGGVFVLVAPSTRLREFCDEAVVRLRSTPAFQTAIWDERDREIKGYLGRAADVRLVALPWVTLSRWCREEVTRCERRLCHQLEETAAVDDSSREWLARNERVKPLHLGRYWVVPFELMGDWADIIEQLDAWLRDLLTPVAAG